MRTTRAPSLLDAVAPVVVLILLIGLTIVIFGTEAADGPLQIALMVSTLFASLVTFKNGYTDASVRDSARVGLAPRIVAHGRRFKHRCVAADSLEQLRRVHE